MADGLNRVTCLGRLGADPELRFTQGGQAVMDLRIACTESWFDKATNQRKEHTEWITCTLWGARAEGLAKVVKKGDLICVEGSIRTTSYDDRDGNKRYQTKVQTSNVVLCGGGKGAGGGGQRGGGASKNEAPSDDGGGYGGGYGSGNGDDIPF
jgi:single-strand DNA-binding protein